MIRTFRGGTHLPDHKDTDHSPIEVIPAPSLLYLSVSQHIGAPAQPLVAKGDRVLRGQMIADVKEGLGVPVHSPVSGEVTDVGVVKVASGASVGCVTVRNDMENTLSPDVKDCEISFSDLDADYVINAVRRGGLSGMGGAGFPTYAKIKSALGKVDTMIVNAVECEPYITADHRLLLEYTEDWLNGVKILLKALSLSKAYVAIESNKPDVIARLKEICVPTGLVEVRELMTKYPQGGERQVISAVTGRVIPAGGLPSDVGCIVFNAATVYAVFQAVARNMPLVERVVTVSGDCVECPKNLLVPLGTPYADLLSYCGQKGEPKKIISGGPMMGQAQWDLSLPVTKGTNSLLFFSEKSCHSPAPEPVCIRCGRCSSACPMRLMPNRVLSATLAGDCDALSKFGVMSCIECGVCAYLCPACIPLVQYMRMGKDKLKERAARQKAAGGKA